MQSKNRLNFYLLPNPLSSDEALAWDRESLINLLDDFKPPVKKVLYTPHNQGGLEGKVLELEKGLEKGYREKAHRFWGMGFIWLGVGLGVFLVFGRFLFKYGYGGLTELVAGSPFISKWLVGMAMMGGVLGGLILALLPLGIGVAKALSYWGRVKVFNRRARALSLLQKEKPEVEISPALTLFWQEATPLTQKLRQMISQSKGNKDIPYEIEEDLQQLFRLTRIHHLDEVVSDYYHHLQAVFYNLRRGRKKMGYEVL